MEKINIYIYNAPTLEIITCQTDVILTSDPESKGDTNFGWNEFN